MTINNETKNSLSISNETKPSNGGIWSGRNLTWAETGPAGDTWAIPGTPIVKESKNPITITNENKN